MQRLASILLGTAVSVAAGLSVASAADLPARRGAPTPYIAAVPVFTWSGFYVGVNAGAAFAAGKSNTFYDPTYGQVTGSGSTAAGFLGGGQVGFNYQLTPGSGFVIGAEADIQALSSGNKTATYVIGTKPYYNVSSDPKWFGTARARVGYAFDRLLVYGTGGFAFGGGSANNTYASAYPYTLSNSSRTGYAVGGGVEYAFTNNLTAKLEALYVNLGSGSSTSGTTYYDATTASYYGTGRQKQDTAIVRAGLNYKFSSF